MKKTLTGLFIAIFLLTFSNVSVAEEVFAHVNLFKALNKSMAGQDAVKKLEEEGQSKKDELQAIQDELAKLKEEYDKKGSLWNEQTTKEKQQVFAGKMKEFEEKSYKYDFEHDKVTKQVEGRILSDLKKIVVDIAKDKKLTYVFESAVGLVYAPESSDITEEVIKLYDANYTKYKKENKKKNKKKKK